MNSTFRAMKNKTFTLLWGGYTISKLGDSIFRVALIWWVVEKTGSSIVMSTVLIFSTVPMLAFLLIGGVLVDRWPRVIVMLVSDFGRGLVVGLMAILSWTNSLEIWHIYLFSAFFGFVDAFFAPSFRAIIPELISQENLHSANSLISLSGQISSILGPAVGAGIVAHGGSSFAFVLNSLSFVFSGLCLLPVMRMESSSKPDKNATSDPQSIWREARQGLEAVFDTSWIWITIVIAGISNLTYSGPMGVALPFLIKNHFEADVNVLGMFYSFSSAGALLATLWIGRYKKIRNRGLKMYGVWMLIGVMVLILGLPINIFGILLASFIIGGANTLLGLIWVNVLQERVPNSLFGRISSVDYLGSSLLEPVGYALGGWANNLIGPALTLVIGGAAQTVLISLGLLHRDVRKLD